VHAEVMEQIDQSIQENWRISTNETAFKWALVMEKLAHDGLQPIWKYFILMTPWNLWTAGPKAAKTMETT
jgi:hypothetical protein